MKFARIAFIFVLAFSTSGRAFESDQFTLPTTELTDVGPQLSAWIYEGLRVAVLKSKSTSTSKDIIQDMLYELSHCKFGKRTFQFSKTAGFCISRYIETSLLVKPIQTPAALYMPSPSIYTKESAPGLFGFFLNDAFKDSDYFWRAFSANAKLYGIIIGLDKIGHFLKLGRDYYAEFLERVDKGARVEDATQLAAQSIGVWHELHFYGKIASGIYSNADLATNFAGLHFYRRMFSGLKIDDVDFEPVVIRDGKRWVLNEKIKPEELLKPFISAHMSEALNPSWYTDHHAPLIRDEIAKRCSQWRDAYPLIRSSAYADLAISLRLWHGRDYGHREQPGGAFTLGRVCSF